MSRCSILLKPLLINHVRALRVQGPQEAFEHSKVRHELTVTVSPAVFSIKIGPMIPFAPKAHHTVTFGECKGASSTSCGRISPPKPIILAVHLTIEMKVCLIRSPNTSQKTWAVGALLQKQFAKFFSLIKISIRQLLRDSQFVGVKSRSSFRIL